MQSMCGCVSRGSLPKRLKADSSGTDYRCAVQSCELSKESYNHKCISDTYGMYFYCSTRCYFLQWKNRKSYLVSTKCCCGKWREKKRLMSCFGLVHIQSSWPSSTQDISRLGLGCKLGWDGLVGCVFTAETGKTRHLWQSASRCLMVLRDHMWQQNNVCVIL